MKRRKIILRIHFCICLLFAAVWGIFIFLSSKQMVSMDEIMFKQIGFVLSVSYLLDYAMTKSKNKLESKGPRS